MVESNIDAVDDPYGYRGNKIITRRMSRTIVEGFTRNSPLHRRRANQQPTSAQVPFGSSYLPHVGSYLSPANFQVLPTPVRQRLISSKVTPDRLSGRQLGIIVDALAKAWTYCLGIRGSHRERQ